MTELNKYKKITEIREKIRDLSLDLGSLVSVLENKIISDEAKRQIEEQAWKMVERIKETIDEHR